MSKIWQNSKIFFLTSIFCSQVVLGQKNPLGNVGKAPTNVQHSAGQSLLDTSVLKNENLSELSSNVFNTDSDAIDFEKGAFMWKGKAFNLEQNFVFQARFERYLSTPPPANGEADKYYDILNGISDTLSTQNLDLQEDDIFNAWNQLFDAGKIPTDGGNSTIIANQVHNAWRVRNEKKGAEANIRELERQRKMEERVVVNRLEMSRSIATNPTMRSSGKNGSKTNSNNSNSTPTNSSGGGSGSSSQSGDNSKENQNVTTNIGMPEVKMPEMPQMPGMPSASDVKSLMPKEYTEMAGNLSEAAFRARDLATTEAKINAIGAQKFATALQAKLQFQSQTLSFFMQRRFQHVLIASNFYRMIFKGSAQRLDVGTSELAQFFPNSNMTFTLETLSQIAQEAVNDTTNSMRAIESAYNAGDKISALKQLQEAFVLGEFMPPVYLFDAMKKRDLLKLYRKMHEAEDLFGSKDYEGVIETVEEIREITDDFSHRQILSVVKSAKNLSDYAINSASHARELGEVEQVQEALEKAIEIWPSNPRIHEFQNETSDLLSMSSQGMQEFDKLYDRQAHREIFDRRNELGLSIAKDEERLLKLDEIVKTIANIDFLLAQTEELIAQDNAYGAWDILENARNLGPEDPKLNKIRADLALRVGNYVNKLDKASRLEKKEEYAGSLTNYLAAQEIYPASQTCRLGIDRVSKSLLSKIGKSLEEENVAINNNTNSSNTAPKTNSQDDLDKMLQEELQDPRFDELREQFKKDPERTMKHLQKKLQ